MALSPLVRYPGQVDVGDPGYPLGKARNATTFGDGTGTPYEKDRSNDVFGFQQALLAEAGLTASGTPDAVGASQYLTAVNFVSTRQAKRAIDAGMLRLRRLVDAADWTDLSDGFACVSAPNALAPILVMRANNNRQVFDGDEMISSSSGPISITSDCAGAARNGARVVAIGTGGLRCSFTVNEGTSWTNGSDLGATPEAIVYNATHSRFMVTFAAGLNVAQDVDGASTWTNVATTLASAQGGIALLAGGNAVVGGLTAAAVDFARSTDGGVVWSIAGGTVPNPSTYLDSGWVAGNSGAAVYHVGRTATHLLVSKSTDGLTWTALFSTAIVATGKPRIFVCPDTGVLVIVAPIAATVGVMLASNDAGLTWTAPRIYRDMPTRNFGIAGGRLFGARAQRLMATDRFPT